MLDDLFCFTVVFAQGQKEMYLQGFYKAEATECGDPKPPIVTPGIGTAAAI